MNIHTVADNLRNTIAGKELALQGYKNDAAEGLMLSAANYATIKFLEVNIDELKRILADVEKCCEKATADSWAGQVDRQGGAFDESELRGRDGWM